MTRKSTKKKKKKKRSTLEASNSFVTGFPGLLREPRFSGHINTFYTFNGYFRCRKYTNFGNIGAESTPKYL